MKGVHKKELTLSYISEYINNNGFPPSIREICTALDIKSTSTVHGYLASLASEGKIKHNKLKKRAISPVKSTKTNIIEVPIIGQVAAGMPILAEDNIEEYFPLPSNMVKTNEVYMLKVKGDSMINAGIMDGDYVIVEKQQTANNGEMVVALIDDEATVKTIYIEKTGIRLQPENDAYQPIFTTKSSIFGKVIGLYRVY